MTFHAVRHDPTNPCPLSWPNRSECVAARKQPAPLVIVFHAPDNQPPLISHGYQIKNLGLSRYINDHQVAQIDPALPHPIIQYALKPDVSPADSRYLIQ